MTDWIDDAEAACEAATEGPWKLEKRIVHEEYYEMVIDLGGTGELQTTESGAMQADMQFVPISRTALPRALAIIRAADELAKIIGEICPVKFGPDVPRPGPAYWSRANEALAAYRKARS